MLVRGAAAAHAHRGARMPVQEVPGRGAESRFSEDVARNKCHGEAVVPLRRRAKAALAIVVLSAGCGERPADPAQIAQGAQLYAQHCASCHGAKLEGQPNWRQRLSNGRMPAPPHDESGHTWHHPDRVLFGITKNGLVPPYALQAYQSDMPAFDGKPSDAEIRGALAYIESHWTSKDILAARAEMIRNTRGR